MTLQSLDIRWVYWHNFNPHLSWVLGDPFWEIRVFCFLSAVETSLDNVYIVLYWFNNTLQTKHSSAVTRHTKLSTLIHIPNFYFSLHPKLFIIFRLPNLASYCYSRTEYLISNSKLNFLFKVSNQLMVKLSQKANSSLFSSRNW